MRVETVTWRRRKYDADGVERYTYDTGERPAPVRSPKGVECADWAQDPNHPVNEPCNQCRHMTCMPWGPCDICRVTIRIRALEEPS